MDIVTVLNVDILFLLDGGRELLPHSAWCSSRTEGSLSVCRRIGLLNKVRDHYLRPDLCGAIPPKHVTEVGSLLFPDLVRQMSQLWCS